MVPRLVVRPFLVHRIVDARQDTHDLAAAHVHADIGADGIHDVNAGDLLELPRACFEAVRPRQQGTDRAKIDQIAGQFAGQRTFEIGGDLGIFAAEQHAHLRRARDLVRKADAARALDAAGHRRLDDRSHIFVFDRALVFVIAAVPATISHGLVLKIAFAALVADRAIERVVDEQKLHHAFARLLDHRRVGADYLAIGDGKRT